MTGPMSNRERLKLDLLLYGNAYMRRDGTRVHPLEATGGPAMVRIPEEREPVYNHEGVEILDPHCVAAAVQAAVNHASDDTPTTDEPPDPDRHPAGYRPQTEAEHLHYEAMAEDVPDHAASRIAELEAVLREAAGTLEMIEAVWGRGKILARDSIRAALNPGTTFLGVDPGAGDSYGGYHCGFCFFTSSSIKEVVDHDCPGPPPRPIDDEPESCPECGHEYDIYGNLPAQHARNGGRDE